MPEHAVWLKQQITSATEVENVDERASARSISTLKGLLSVDVPDKVLHEAARRVEKAAEKIFATHSGRTAMLRVLGKNFYRNEVDRHHELHG